MGRGRVESAVEELRSLVSDLPVSKRGALSLTLYWLGIGLLRDGHKAAALRSIASSQRLVKRGHARSLYLRFSNAYGMPRLANEREDDRAAFQSVQIARYLSRRPRRSFASSCERDAILDLIEDAWKGLERMGVLKGKGPEEKLARFKAVKIVFPMRGPERAFEMPDISVDFQSGRRIPAEGSCPCGSGLAYSRCCGRRASLCEAERGYV